MNLELVNIFLDADSVGMIVTRANGDKGRIVGHEISEDNAMKDKFIAEFPADAYTRFTNRGKEIHQPKKEYDRFGEATTKVSVHKLIAIHPC